MKYWDSSALVALALEQKASDEARHLLTVDSGVITWWASLVECHSAVCRLERMREIDPAEADGARARLAGLSAGWQEIQPHIHLRDTALELVRRHDLRTGDALQLAAALAASSQLAHPLDFVTYDARLAQAARSEGFQLSTRTYR